MHTWLQLHVHTCTHHSWRKQNCTRSKLDPIKEGRKRAAWCTRAVSYVKWMNKIIRADKSKCSNLVKAMKAELKCPKDVSKELTTTSFLSNQFSICNTEKAVVPVERAGESDTVRWFVFACLHVWHDCSHVCMSMYIDRVFTCWQCDL